MIGQQPGPVVSRQGVSGLIVALSVTVVVLFLVSLLVGRGLSALQPAWWYQLIANPGLLQTLFLEIRLPRAALGLLTGAALGMAGAALQGLLRNPLADPGVIGTSSGAALGAVIVFYFGLAGATSLALPLGGILGAAGALLLLFAVAGWSAPTLTLILTGVAIAALCGAFTSLALNLAPSPFAAFEIVSWTLGSLTDRSLEHLALAAPLMLLGMAVLYRLQTPLDALALGEDTAVSLGANVRRTRITAVVGTTVAVGAAVAVTGVIGFVGLVAPHLVRRACGHAPGATLVPAALAGAALLLMADICVRLVTVGPELKLGVVTALVGAPFFLHLITITRREGQ